MSHRVLVKSHIETRVGFSRQFRLSVDVRGVVLLRTATFFFRHADRQTMKISLLIGALFALTLSQVHAQAPAGADVWGKSPSASDDRFSNPKSKLYAGPDGYWNAGEVRAGTGSTT